MTSCAHYPTGITGTPTPALQAGRTERRSWATDRDRGSVPSGYMATNSRQLERSGGPRRGRPRRARCCGRPGLAVDGQPPDDRQVEQAPSQAGKRPALQQVVVEQQRVGSSWWLAATIAPPLGDAVTAREVEPEQPRQDAALQGAQGAVDPLRAAATARDRRRSRRDEGRSRVAGAQIGLVAGADHGSRSSARKTAEPATKTSAPASTHRSMVFSETPPSTWILNPRPAFFARARVRRIFGSMMSRNDWPPARLDGRGEDHVEARERVLVQGDVGRRAQHRRAPPRGAQVRASFTGTGRPRLGRNVTDSQPASA